MSDEELANAVDVSNITEFVAVDGLITDVVGVGAAEFPDTTKSIEDTIGDYTCI